MPSLSAYTLPTKQVIHKKVQDSSSFLKFTLGILVKLGERQF